MNLNLPKILLSLIIFSCCAYLSNAQNKTTNILGKQKDSLVNLIDRINAQLSLLQSKKDKNVKELDIVISKINLQEFDTIRKHGALRIIAISTCRVRKEPSILSNEIIVLSAGDTVFVHEIKGDYLKIRYKNQIGYINKICISSLVDNMQMQRSSIFNGDNTGKSLPDNRQLNVVSNSICSSTQCSGSTKRGKRCRNMTTTCNGMYHLHRKLFPS